MKFSFFLNQSRLLFLALNLCAVLIAPQSFAGAVASLWNGDQFNLNGTTLVQTADNPNKFYIVPTYYRIKTIGEFNPDTGLAENKIFLKHKVISQSGSKFSIYNITLALDEPTMYELNMATISLRRIVGPQASIIGLVPACAMNLNIPNFSGAPTASSVEEATTQIRYSINSTDGSCNSVISNTEFSLQIKTPFAREPEFANAITSDAGLILPAIEISMPYKYKNKVVMRLNAKTVHNNLNTNVGLTGTWKAVTAAVDDSMKKMFSFLSMTGAVSIDWQGLDDVALRDQFVNQALAILSRNLIRYETITAPGEDKNKTTIGDNNKAIDTNMYKLSLAFDQSSAEQMGEIVIDFSNVAYSTIKSLVQLNLSQVPATLLDPQVQVLLNN